MALPQREGRPSLDLSPDATPNTAAWDEDYGNVGMNPLNKPVPLHKGEWPENGWMEVASLVQPTAGSGNGKEGSEKR